MESHLKRPRKIEQADAVVRVAISPDDIEASAAATERGLFKAIEEIERVNASRKGKRKLGRHIEIACLDAVGNKTAVFDLSPGGRPPEMFSSKTAIPKGLSKFQYAVATDERGEKIVVRIEFEVPWTPLKEIALTPELLEQYPKSPDKPPPDRFFANSRYCVFWLENKITQGALIRLAIRNRDHSDKHDWRDFQRIKNELLGPEEEAVELYPAESRLTDTKNEYHLWCIRGKPWSCIGWNEREVSEASERQRPWPEGEEPADLKRGED